MSRTVVMNSLCVFLNHTYRHNYHFKENVAGVAIVMHDMGMHKINDLYHDFWKSTAIVLDDKAGHLIL